MGSTTTTTTTLNLIIAFNLAIAHHQKALLQVGSNISTCSTNTTVDNNNNILIREKIIEKTLCLYEIILKLQQQQSRQLHNLTTTRHANSGNSNGNDNDHDHDCIRFNMIIHNNLSQLYRMSNNHTKHRQSLQNLLSTVMVVVEHETRRVDDNDYSSSDEIATGAASRRKNIYLDGFLQNTTPLILQERCAEAA